MIAAIIEAISAIFRSIPIFDKWFTKTTEQKIQDEKDKIRKDMEELKKTGRPPS